VHHSPAPPRQPQSGELLFEFHVAATHTFWRVELRDHGQYGIEAQFLDPIDLRYARTFPQYLDPKQEVPWLTKTGLRIWAASDLCGRSPAMPGLC